MSREKEKTAPRYGPTVFIIRDPFPVSVIIVFCFSQVLIQGLQNLNRAVHQDVVAVQLLPREQWLAPSSVVLQDVGTAKDDNAEEDEEKPVGLVVMVVSVHCLSTYSLCVCVCS